VTGDKCVNKSITIWNYEVAHQCTDLREWYVSLVVEPTLASLEEFQEHDNGWRLLSCILNLTANKHNLLHVEYHIKLSPEIMLKKAVINVQSADNACIAWYVDPAQRNVEREFSYPHYYIYINYMSILNLAGLEFPMTLNQIKKFETLNNIFINNYTMRRGL